jgi:hypothetical protein
MKVKFEDLEMAYEFVSSAPYGENVALLDGATGNIFYSSMITGDDEITEDMWASEDTIEIPGKMELGLGKQLVFEFVEHHIPDDVRQIREFFSRRGAYSRYKEFLDSKGLLEKWYDFEETAQQEALRHWCVKNEIELVG